MTDPSAEDPSGLSESESSESKAESSESKDKTSKPRGGSSNAKAVESRSQAETLDSKKESSAAKKESSEGKSEASEPSKEAQQKKTPSTVAAKTPPAISPALPDPPPIAGASVLLKTALVFYVSLTLVWIGFAWRGTREGYAGGSELRKVGESVQIEITLVREDKQTLSCASPQNFGGHYCGFERPGVPRPGGEDEAMILRPYSTVQGEQLLAAGLWAQPALRDPLPSRRFSVVCYFKVLGSLKNGWARWGAEGQFGPIPKPWWVGEVHDCVLPK